MEDKDPLNRFLDAVSPLYGKIPTMEERARSERSEAENHAAWASSPRRYRYRIDYQHERWGDWIVGCYEECDNDRQLAIYLRPWFDAKGEDRVRYEVVLKRW